MNELVETLNFFLALGGVVLFLGALLLFFDRATNRIFLPFVRRWGMWLVFVLSIAGVALTLLYSDVFGFVPCGLCWLQRVFLYPHLFLSGTALFLKEQVIARYGMVLAFPGLLLGVYQHLLQMGVFETLLCPATGAGASCRERILFEFGFMTFPLLSAVLFFFLIALYCYLHTAHKHKEEVA